MFLYGLCGAGRSAVGYLYLLELIPKERRAIAGAMFHSFNELTLVFSSLYFMYVSKEG